MVVLEVRESNSMTLVRFKDGILYLPKHTIDMYEQEWNEADILALLEILMNSSE